MRCEFEGGYPGNLAPVVLTLVDSVDFEAAGYLALGYTHYDVICIGASGGIGSGARLHRDYNGETRTWQGGIGGGGGMQRVKGLLSSLPAVSPVVVGVVGGDGPYFIYDHIVDAADDAAKFNYVEVNAFDAGDGGPSSFNINTCKASGGKGGKTMFHVEAGQTGRGGQGGLGGTSVAGGGGAGGVNNYSGPPSDGADGGWNGSIGAGGGGGGGGIQLVTTSHIGEQLWMATKGGRGSYSADDSSLYGPGGSVTGLITPGAGGGAKATPVNRLPDVYGSKLLVGGVRLVGNGAVIIRITQED